MAGRGRGGNVGGRPSTFTHDQLQTLGASKDLSTTVIMSPPPIYPILQSKPIPLEVRFTFILINNKKLLIYFYF